MNQQKFTFSLSGNRVSAKAGAGFYTKIDLGIANTILSWEPGPGTLRGPDPMRGAYVSRCRVSAEKEPSSRKSGGWFLVLWTARLFNPLRPDRSDGRPPYGRSELPAGRARCGGTPQWRKGSGCGIRSPEIRRCGRGALPQGGVAALLGQVGHRGKQRLGIGVQRLGKEGVGGGLFTREPRYITPMRWERYRTTPMSWEIKSRLRFISRCSRVSILRIWAWMDTSRAETGSSQTMSRGPMIRAGRCPGAGPVRPRARGGSGSSAPPTGPPSPRYP